MLYAQEIRIRVLDGRNGHPVQDCVSIQTSPRQRTPLLTLRTSREGVAVLSVSDEQAGTAVGTDRLPCKDAPTLGRVGRVDTIGIWPDWDLDCRPLGESGRLPPRLKLYPVEEILKLGVATENACGRVEASPAAGELIFFVRPAHWWEAIRR